jgi:hypothetical protein
MGFWMEVPIYSWQYLSYPSIEKFLREHLSKQIEELYGKPRYAGWQQT